MNQQAILKKSKTFILQAQFVEQLAALIEDEQTLILQGEGIKMGPLHSRVIFGQVHRRHSRVRAQPVWVLHEGQPIELADYKVAFLQAMYSPHDSHVEQQISVIIHSAVLFSPETQEAYPVSIRFRYNNHNPLDFTKAYITFL